LLALPALLALFAASIIIIDTYTPIVAILQNNRTITGIYTCPEIRNGVDAAGEHEITHSTDRA
jgi:hypothetical protein